MSPSEPPSTPAPTPAGGASAAALRAVLDAVGDAVLVYELGPEGPGRFVEVNEEAVRRYGYTRAELLAMGPLDLLAPGSVDVGAVMARLRADGRAHATALHRTKDGRVIEVEVSVRRFDLGGRPAAVSVAHDVTARAQAEAALRASEERFRLAQRVARIGTWEADPATGEAMWSDGMWELVGLAPQERPPDDALWRTLVHPDDADGALARYERAVAEGDALDDEFRLVRPADGAVVHVVTRARVFRDEGGRAVRVLGVDYDVTEIRRAEAALRASEARFRHLADAIPQLAFVSEGPPGEAPVPVYYNERWYAYTGMPRPGDPDADALPGVSGRAYIHPDDRDATLAEQRRAAETATPFELEYRLRGADGAYRWFLGRSEPVRAEGEPVVRWFGTATDIHDRRRAEAALRESEERLRVALKHAPIIIQRLDRDLRYEWVYNPHPDTPQDLIGLEAGTTRPPEEAAPYVRMLREVLDTGRGARQELTFRMPSGPVVTDLTVEPVRDEAGAVVGVLTSSYDVTEIRLAEAALREAHAALEEANIELEEANVELEARVAARTAEARAAAAAAEVAAERLDAVLNGTTDLIAAVDADYRVLAVNAGFNATFEAAYGRPLRVGMTFEEALPEQSEEERAASYADWARVLAGETFSKLQAREYPVLGFRAFETRYSPVRSATGAVTGGVAVVRDVTDREVAQAAVRESEARFRLLVEGVHDYAIFLLDPEGRVVSWNAGAERAKGYTAGEVLGRHFSLFFPEEAVAAGLPEQELQRAAAEGRSEAEGWRVRKDGGRFWASAVLTALHDEEGRLTGFAKITRDVTERRTAEEALRESEARFRSLFHSTPIGVAVIGLDGRLIDANPALHELLGYAPGTLAGTTVAELTHPGDRALTAALSADLHAGRRATLSLEKRYLRADGGAVWAQTTVSAVRDDDGAPLYTVASVADVTERRRLEQAAVEAAETERRRISYEIHDDLAQRLAGISVLSHTLAEQLAAERHAGARAAARVGELARDTMTHARALSRALAPVDLLAEGLGEALERLCASTEAAYDVRCRVAAAASVKVAEPAVATHLFRIAQEAVSNAARHAAAQEVALTLAPDGDRLRLVVADDGRGIPEGTMATSAGLGLRTMRARAAALGGTLVVESAPGAGTTVTCVIPRPQG